MPKEDDSITGGDPDGPLDPIDTRLVRVLATQGRMPVTELAKTIGISKTPCGLRLKRLVEERFILGFRAVLNPAKLDRNHVAFAQVRLRDTTEATLLAFNAAVQDVPEIEECHMIAGAFDYLLKVRTRDIAGYRRVLGEQISGLPQVASSSTYVAMETVKESGV